VYTCVVGLTDRQVNWPSATFFFGQAAAATYSEISKWINNLSR